MPSKGPITLQTDLQQTAALLPDVRLRVCNDSAHASRSSSREIAMPRLLPPPHLINSAIVDTSDIPRMCATEATNAVRRHTGGKLLPVLCHGPGRVCTLHSPAR